MHHCFVFFVGRCEKFNCGGSLYFLANPVKFTVNIFDQHSRWVRMYDEEVWRKLHELPKLHANCPNPESSSYVLLNHVKFMFQVFTRKEYPCARSKESFPSQCTNYLFPLDYMVFLFPLCDFFFGWWNSGSFFDVLGRKNHAHNKPTIFWGPWIFFLRECLTIPGPWVFSVASLYFPFMITILSLNHPYLIQGFPGLPCASHLVIDHCLWAI